MLSSADFVSRTPETEGPPQEREESQTEAGYEGTMRSLSSGQIVSGLVVHLDEHGALVDVGTKSEGLIPQQEIGEPTTEEGRPLAVGQRIDVYVLKPEDEEGAALLSKKRADYEAVWKKISRAYETGEVLTAMVTERVKGGLVVDLGVRAFLPASHVNARNVQSLERFVGRAIRLKILEVDRDRKRVVVSHREAQAQLREKRRRATLDSLKEGQVRRGIVRRLTDYGAFVDIGGVDGLLHVTEMSWSYLPHPGELVKVGDRIEVMVLKVDRERERISLGLKQILPDPWEEVGRKYHVGDLVIGRLTRRVPTGVFMRLPEGIEGIVPSAELETDSRAKKEEVSLPTEEVEARILSIRPSERRLTLSLRLAHQERDRREVRQYLARQSASNRLTIGDIVGDSLHGSALKIGSSQSANEKGAAPPPISAETPWEQPLVSGENPPCESSASAEASEQEKAPSPDSSAAAAQS